MNDIKVLALDLDGTLTQHRTPLAEPNIGVLNALGERYKLLMVGAGQSLRIFRQMGEYPIDIIGNYGMQYCTYDREKNTLVPVFDEHAPCNRESVSERIGILREKYGYTEFAGDSVEFHDSGCVTFPLLGTRARIEDKIAFDPTHARRRIMYEDVKETFSDYTVFIGGSSSFDFAPKPYDKYYALDRYCRDHGLRHEELVYIGDDYREGGNDEAVYRSDFRFVCVDDYTRFGFYVKEFLE